MSTAIAQAEKALAVKPQPSANPTSKAETKSTQPQAELVDALRRAHANGQLGGVVPVDADGNTVQEYMHQLAGSVLNQAMPELMQQMGAADRNPIMQAASGLFPVFCLIFISFLFFGYFGFLPWLAPLVVSYPSKSDVKKSKGLCAV